MANPLNAAVRVFMQNYFSLKLIQNHVLQVLQNASFKE